MKTAAAEEQRNHAKTWLAKAAKAEDAGEPLKSLDEGSTEQAMEAINASQVFGLIRVDDVSDAIGVTIAGRLFAGVRMADTPDLGQARTAELKGSVREGELAARYIDGKIAGAERLKREGKYDPETLQVVARVLAEIANEFRRDFHIPQRIIEGSVKPYNDDNETGVKHSANLALFFSDVHERNCRAGWWSDLETGEPKKRNVGELFMLFVTEIVEAYLAYIVNEKDDKLPDYPGLGVEIGDLAIRMADFAGAAMAGKIVTYSGVRNPGEKLFDRVVKIAGQYEAIRKTPDAIGAPEEGEPLPPMDIPLMIDEKLAFNAQREDHKIEQRMKPDGKKT